MFSIAESIAALVQNGTIEALVSIVQREGLDDMAKEEICRILANLSDTGT